MYTGTLYATFAMMAAKCFNFFMLLVFVNTITYFPQSSLRGMGGQYAVNAYLSGSSEADMPEFDGDTLLECLLNDVLELPLHETDPDPDLFTKILSFLGNLICSTPLWVYQVSLIPLLALLSSKVVFSIAHSSKLKHLLGYYTFLFRLKPF